MQIRDILKSDAQSDVQWCCCTFHTNEWKTGFVDSWCRIDRVCFNTDYATKYSDASTCSYTNVFMCFKKKKSIGFWSCERGIYATGSVQKSKSHVRIEELCLLGVCQICLLFRYSAWISTVLFMLNIVQLDGFYPASNCF